jgi:hypothetical protein
MFAPHFSLEHLLLFIHGYEAALKDAGLPSQHAPFEEWLHGQNPAWRESSMWWGKHLLEQCGGDLEHTLLELTLLMNQFLASTRTPPPAT